MSKADTTTTAPEVTEEQVKTANAAEEAKWQDDFKEEDLNIPYKREEKEDPEEETVATDEVKEDEADTEDLEVVDDPEPVVTTEDPGEYVAADYSFEVTLADGKKVTINTPAEAEKLADDPENFETPKQLMDFINKQAKMNANLDRDRAKWEAQKEEHDKQAAIEKEQLETISNFAAEFDYLAQKGLIPKLSKTLKNADWRDPEIAKDPNVKVYNDILDYLVAENKLRAKAKVKPLTSIVDAYSAWKLEDNKKQEDDEVKQAGEARKAAGSRVAGVAPSQQGSFVPKGIAVGNPNVFKRGAAQWDD